VIPLQNVWNFFSTYASVDNWKTPDTQLFFMRHAKKAAADTVEDPNIPLSEEGKAQLLSDEFREKVVRIHPDIIYASPSIRAQQTAE
jgi:phosphohistidine phosphatase SixA